MIDWSPLWLSLRLAAVTTAVLLMIGIPIAWGLAYNQRRWKTIAETILSLPMVLPPSVLGFYLLLAFSPIHLVFTFPGLIVASIIYSLPFMINPLLAGFRQLPGSLNEAAQTLGKSKTTILFRVLLPNMRASVITGAVLAFAHTIGEFGVVMMIGGGIPGQTRVASVAIWDEVQSIHYPQANRYAIALLAISFTILFVVHRYNKNNP